MPRDEPRYMGGQAVLEGVMMRGASTWAVAVRDPDGAIKVDVREVPGWAERYRDIPVVRGRDGSRRVARARVPRAHVVGEPAGARGGAGLREGDGLGGRRRRGRVHRAVHRDARARRPLARSPLPRFVPDRRRRRPARALRRVPARDLRIRDIRRVFQYHGAEHKAIAAYENDVELTPETAQQFSTAHVRCGTNFLLTVMVVAILVYSVIPRPNLVFVIGSRIVLIPVIAGLSYEVIRLAAANMNRAVGAGAHAPRAAAAEAHDPPARPRPARGRDRVVAGRDDGRPARRGRRPRRPARPRGRSRASRPVAGACAGVAGRTAAHAATVAWSAAVSDTTNSSSCAARPWSSQSRTASTRWSNSVCAAHSASSGATSGVTTSRAAFDRDVAQVQRVVAELRFPGRVAPQQAEAVGPFAGDGEQRAGAALGLEALGDVRQEQLDLAVEDLLEHGAVERLLRLEVAVDDQLRDAGRRRDLVHRRRRVPRVRERLGRGLEHGEAAGRAPAGDRRRLGHLDGRACHRCNSSVYTWDL